METEAEKLARKQAPSVIGFDAAEIIDPDPAVADAPVVESAQDEAAPVEDGAA